MDAVVKEIDLRKDLLFNRKIKTVYFGGGTPSLLKPHLLGKVIETLSQVSSFYENME
ncbi:coproporphyrinogen III oxidase family protein, partial [candidate division TA06 bacterium]